MGLTYVIGTALIPLHFCSYRLCLEEQKQVIGTARLGVRSGHVEATEGVRAHHRSSAFPIEIQVAHMETAFGLVQMFRVVGEDRSGKSVLRVVGEFQSMLEIVGFRNS